MKGGVIDELILTAPICISQSDGLKLKEVADKGAGEVLGEGGEGARPRHFSGLEGLQNRIRQAGLVH